MIHTAHKAAMTAPARPVSSQSSSASLWVWLTKVLGSKSLVFSKAPDSNERSQARPDGRSQGQHSWCCARRECGRQPGILAEPPRTRYRPSCTRKIAVRTAKPSRAWLASSPIPRADRSTPTEMSRATQPWSGRPAHRVATLRRRTPPANIPASAERLRPRTDVDPAIPGRHAASRPRRQL